MVPEERDEMRERERGRNYMPREQKRKKQVGVEWSERTSFSDAACTGKKKGFLTPEFLDFLASPCIMYASRERRGIRSQNAKKRVIYHTIMVPVPRKGPNCQISLKESFFSCRGLRRTALKSLNREACLNRSSFDYV